MRRVFVIGIRADSSPSLLYGNGSDLTHNKVLDAFHVARSTGQLPAGFVRLEAYDSDRGRIGIALPRVQSEADTTIETKSKKSKTT